MEIPEKTIRSEEFEGSLFRIKNQLEDIPMTSYQRKEVEYLLDCLHFTFVKANTSHD